MVPFQSPRAESLRDAQLDAEELFLWHGDGAAAEAVRRADLAAGARDHTLRLHWLAVARRIEDLIGLMKAGCLRPRTHHAEVGEAMRGLSEIAEDFIHLSNGDDDGTSIHNIEARTRQIADVIGRDDAYVEIVHRFLEKCRSISTTSREDRRSARIYTPDIMAASRDLLRLRRHVSRALA